MKVRAKICGLKTVEAIETAQDNGAEFLGFIFCANSPRHLAPIEAGRLGKAAKAKKVAVVVDADDSLLKAIVDELKPDYIQLHGQESDERAKDIKAKFGIPLIRSRHPDNPEAGDLYDYLLIDPGKGGQGIAFDWENFSAPDQSWFLSGGLNPENVREAIKATNAQFVDVSSGVESSKGVKDLQKIKDFLKAINDIR